MSEDVKPLTSPQMEAERLAGRPIEVVKTIDGKYIVEWFSYSAPPPPKADTVCDAIDGFINHIKGLSQPPKDDGLGVAKGEE